MVSKSWVIFNSLKMSIFTSCIVFCVITCDYARADGYLPKELWSMEDPRQGRGLLTGTAAHEGLMLEPSTDHAPTIHPLRCLGQSGRG